LAASIISGGVIQSMEELEK
jgi:hypothetical protein